MPEQGSSGIFLGSGASLLEDRESGGIGRRAGFRIPWGNPWEFESPLSHRYEIKFSIAGTSPLNAFPL